MLKTSSPPLRLYNNQSKESRNSYYDLLFSIPKGFKNFYPKQANKSTGKKNGTETDPLKSFSKNKNGNGGGKSPNGDPNEFWKVIGPVILSGGALVYLLMDGRKGR